MTRLGELLEFKKIKGPAKTFFPQGTFSEPASKIVKVASSKKYAPGGLGSAISWINYYKGRAGKNIKPAQQAEINKARKELSAKLAKQNAKKKGKSKDAKPKGESVDRLRSRMSLMEDNALTPKQKKGIEDLKKAVEKTWDREDLYAAEEVASNFEDGMEGIRRRGGLAYVDSVRLRKAKLPQDVKIDFDVFLKAPHGGLGTRDGRKAADDFESDVEEVASIYKNDDGEEGTIYASVHKRQSPKKTKDGLLFRYTLGIDRSEVETTYEE